MYQFTKPNPHSKTQFVSPKEAVWITHTDTMSSFISVTAIGNKTKEHNFVLEISID